MVFKENTEAHKVIGHGADIKRGVYSIEFKITRPIPLSFMAIPNKTVKREEDKIPLKKDIIKKIFKSPLYYSGMIYILGQYHKPFEIALLNYFVEEVINKSWHEEIERSLWFYHTLLDLYGNILFTDNLTHKRKFQLIYSNIKQYTTIDNIRHRILSNEPKILKELIKNAEEIKSYIERADYHSYGFEFDKHEISGVHLNGYLLFNDLGKEWREEIIRDNLYGNYFFAFSDLFYYYFFFNRINHIIEKENIIDKFIKEHKKRNILNVLDIDAYELKNFLKELNSLIEQKYVDILWDYNTNEIFIDAILEPLGINRYQSNGSYHQYLSALFFAYMLEKMFKVKLPESYKKGIVFMLLIEMADNSSFYNWSLSHIIEYQLEWKKLMKLYHNAKKGNKNSTRILIKMEKQIDKLEINSGLKSNIKQVIKKLSKIDYMILKGDERVNKTFTFYDKHKKDMKLIDMLIFKDLMEIKNLK